MNKQKQDDLTRMYVRCSRIERMGDWLYSVSDATEVARMVMECHELSMVVGRLRLVGKAQWQLGTSFATPKAELLERIEVLEMKVENALSQWVLRGAFPEETYRVTNDTVRISK